MTQRNCDRYAIGRDHLAQAATAAAADGYRLALVAAHDDQTDFRIVYVWLRPGRATRLEHVVTLAHDDARLPSLASLSFPAGRFEREMHDLFGIALADHPLPSRLVRHGHWPRGWYPMRSDARTTPAFEPDLGTYPFIEVAGPGVYEIPVGPVHAGLIEPGHFRFSAVGETILKLKARLWFVHRGVERLFEGRTPEQGIELAERISGDTAVGHSLAFAAAVEDAHEIQVEWPHRQARALLLELERLHNHVSDLGAMANDAGYGIINSHAQRLREQLLRVNQQVTGHRLLRGAVVIGASRLRSLPDPGQIRTIADQAGNLAGLTLGNSIARDRFTATSVLTAGQARELGTLGYVARASGLDIDARRDHPSADLGPGFEVITESAGDVLARFCVRVREIAVSAEVIAHLVGDLGGPPDSATSPVAPTTTRAGSGPAPAQRAGFGLAEAWRGTACCRVEIDTTGHLIRVKVVDPSFFNWPALPAALTETIVPDFPLTNKSFNQSYAGNDL